MFTERSDGNPVAKAMAMTPWWMQHIREFQSVEMHPSKIAGYVPGGWFFMPCKEELATHWSVYGRYKSDDGELGIIPFEDFQTQGEAKIFMDKVLEIFPHLSRNRPSLQGSAFVSLTNE